MGKHLRGPKPTIGLQPVEILHVDTESSRKLYDAVQASPSDKVRAAAMFQRHFFASCAKFRGIVRSWAGDGGFALFPSTKRIGKSVDAAVQFLHNLKYVNEATARALDVSEFPRSVRVKIHRGEVYVTADAGLDSASPADFDDFLKYEKKFAPVADEVFITHSLYAMLSAHDKRRFESYQTVTAGSLSTEVHRLRAQPAPQATDIFSNGDNTASITHDEWTYLKTVIVAHKKNVAACNEITKGLIDTLEAGRDSKIRSRDLMDLTLSSLYNYLRTVFPRNRFRVSFWRPLQSLGRMRLARVAYHYPPGDGPRLPRRTLDAEDVRFKVCEAYQRIELIATPSVVAARREGSWIDFDSKQAGTRRGLSSALQIPVYWCDAVGRRVAQGVVSLDSDRPDVFLQEETELWRDELVGFLVNISLSEKLSERGG